MNYKKGKYTANKTRKKEVLYVGSNMRPVDIVEVYLSEGMNPMQALQTSVERSDESYTMSYDEKPFAIFGVSSNKRAEKCSAIWMLGTNALYDHVKGFHHMTLEYLKHFYEKNDILFNFVSEKNKSSIHWLEQLGAEFSKPQPYGKFGTNFSFFKLRSN